MLLSKAVQFLLMAATPILFASLDAWCVRMRHGEANEIKKVIQSVCYVLLFTMSYLGEDGRKVLAKITAPALQGRHTPMFPKQQTIV